MNITGILFLGLVGVLFFIFIIFSAYGYGYLTGYSNAEEKHKK